MFCKTVNTLSHALLNLTNQRVRQMGASEVATRVILAALLSTSYPITNFSNGCIFIRHL